MSEVYPEINIRVLYWRDYHRILVKFGFGPLAQTDVTGIDRVRFTAPQIQWGVRGSAGRYPATVRVWSRCSLGW